MVTSLLKKTRFTVIISKSKCFYLKFILDYESPTLIQEAFKRSILPQTGYGIEFQSSRYISCFCSTCLPPDVPRWHQSPEQDLYSLHDYRISASLTQISLVHASYHHGTNGGRSAILKKSTAELDSGLLGLLILCGDISSNPGPKCKHPCGICSKTVRSNQRAVQCDSCNAWYHVKCMQMNTHVYEALANSSCIWECVVCGLPNFSSSLFESSTIEATNYFWPLDTDLSDKSHIESIYTVNQLIY